MVYLFIEFFAGFFLNAFNIVMTILFILIGVFGGLMLRRRMHRTEVMKLQPRDARFIDFKVERENAFSLECKKKKGFPTQRFMKDQKGYTGVVGNLMKKTVTRFLGLEGTAFTAGIAGMGKTLINASLGQTLMVLWGERFYKEIPEKQRRLAEESKINVTIDVEKTLTPPDKSPISEEDVKTETDRKAAETWWKGKQASEKKELTETMFLLLAGAGIMMIAAKLLQWI